MYKKILIFLATLMVGSCGLIKHVPVETKVIYTYKDSTVISYKDSTIFVEIPKEVIRDVVPQYDTLIMETSVAKSVSFVDTLTHTLKGQLNNKDAEVLYKTIYLPSEEHIVYKDSIVTQEVPVEVEVIKKVYPKSWGWLLAWFILSIVSIIGYTYLKVKNIKLF